MPNEQKHDTLERFETKQSSFLLFPAQKAVRIFDRDLHLAQLQCTNARASERTSQATAAAMAAGSLG